MLNAIRTTAVPVLILFATLLITVGAACGSGDGDRLEVTGQVTRVVGSSVTALSELDIVDDDGVTWKFEARGFVGFTPSHVEEHAATGASVRVQYFEKDGKLIVIEASDG